MVEIAQLQKDDISALQSIKNHKESVFYEYFQRGIVFGAFDDGALCGFSLYNACPKYHIYQRLSIPEIQDLIIHPNFRRRGFARAIITACEAHAIEQGQDMIGISVGVSAKFGAAQCLYASMGYRPDGQGVTYDRGQVAHGARFPVDDDLCLMLVKELQQK